MTKTNTEMFAEVGKKLIEAGELLLASVNLDSPVAETTATKTSSKKPASKEKVSVADEVKSSYTEDELQDMQIGELKALADDLDVEYPRTIKKQPLIKRLLESFEESEEEEEEEELEDTEVEADEEEEVDADEDDEDEVSDTVIDTEDGEVDLADMTLKELKAFGNEYEIKVTAKTKDEAIAQILESLYDEEEVEEAEEEDIEEEDEEEGIDLEEMDIDELKELAKENGIKLPAKKKSQKASAYLEAVRELIAEELSEADEEEEEEEEEADIAEELGLNDMSVEELAEYLEEYELSTKGKKQALIARIVKAVEDGVIEVEGE